VAQEPAHCLAELLRATFTDELDLLRACFVWMVRLAVQFPIAFEEPLETSLTPLLGVSTEW
jgi:hypothetical protein